MKTQLKNPMYKIDSCLGKLKYQTINVCNPPSRRTVCNTQIVNRDLLTHRDYLNMLSTPKGFKWTGTSYFKNFSKDEIYQLNQLKQYNSQKSYKGKNEKYKKYSLKKLDKIHKQNINYQDGSGAQKQKRFYDISKNEKYKLHGLKKLDKLYQQKSYMDKNDKKKRFNEILNEYPVDANEFHNYQTTNAIKNTSNSNLITFNYTDKPNVKNKTNNSIYKTGNDKRNENNMLNENENSSTEKLKQIKKQREADYLMKKKKLWLYAEKRRKKKEEKENKLKSALQTKQRAHEELKKKMEDKVKLKMKRKQILEEERRKQRLKKEKEEMAKLQIITEKKILEESARLRNEAEQIFRLEALKAEAKRIVQEEEEWRNKINREFALKMGNTINSNNDALAILSNIANNKDEHLMTKAGKERFIQYTTNLLEEINKNNEVFDPGNLMKQIIKKELNKAQKRQVQIKKQLETLYRSFDNIKNTQVINIEDKKEKHDPAKSIVFKKDCGLNNTNEFQNSKNNRIDIKLYDHCVPNKHVNISRCKTPDLCCYSNTSFNTIVGHWKDEVADMISNMQKRRYNFIQNAKAHNMWEDPIKFKKIK